MGTAVNYELKAVNYGNRSELLILGTMETRGPIEHYEESYKNIELM